MLLGWLIVSSGFCIWLYFSVRLRHRVINNDAMTVIVFLGAFISLTLVLDHGFEKLLAFIPDNWGGFDEDGEFVTTRSSIAIFLAAITSIFFGCMFFRIGELRKENRELKTIVEIENRKKDLKYLSRESLTRKCEETETLLSKLRKQALRRYGKECTDSDIPPDELAEMEIHRDILYIIRTMLDQNNPSNLIDDEE